MKNDPLDEEAIFNVARKMPAESRADYLRQACADDDALSGRVAALLHVTDEHQDFLEQPISPAVATFDAPSNSEPITEQIGDVIGPYKLREQIGEGGMGVVFVAEQEQPIRRKVALKIIKPGMDSRQVLARFEAERQALAMMDHPNIAKVYDAGTTDGGKGDRSNLCEAPSGPSRQIGPVPFSAGRPYFVMELVRGLPITEYCDNAKLPTRQRLELFITVCRAVQHAHLKGIIHRDIKPSNVLVTQIDGAAVPKVIDFGVAKAINQQLSEQTVYTQFAQMIGTPLYMSPEQAEMSGVDVDTRADVYSLGVLLYELLTGMTPFDKETLKKAAFDEMRRMIREDEPPRPSDRLSTLTAEKLSTVSDQRAIDGRKLSKSLRGEVDWIVMKALEKDRNRRYESASDFAADLERHLNDEPVEACPPSAGYRFGKFARRNKTAFVTTTLVAISLIAGTGISLWQAVRATKAERLAEQRLSDEQRARTEAERQRALADSRRQSAGTNLRMMAETSGIYSERFFDDEDLTDRLTVSQLGAYRYSVQKHSKLIADLEKLVAELPNDREVMFDLATSHAARGICLANLGEFDKAIVEIQRATALVHEANHYAATREERRYLHGGVDRILGRLFRKTNRLDMAWLNSMPLGLTFGPNGDLFLGSRALDCMLQMDVRRGRDIRVFAKGGGLKSPNGLIFGPDKHLYVCREFGDCVLQYDGATGQYMKVFAKDIRHPVGLAFGPDGNLFVSNGRTDSVLRYDGRSGRFLGTLVHRAGLRPGGLAFGPNNRLYVLGSSTGMYGFHALHCSMR